MRSVGDVLSEMSRDAKKKQEYEFWIKEFEKCKQNPVYFYNNYTTQGKANPITQEKWDQILSMINNGNTK